MRSTVSMQSARNCWGVRPSSEICSMYFGVKPNAIRLQLVLVKQFVCDSAGGFCSKYNVSGGLVLQSYPFIPGYSPAGWRKTQFPGYRSRPVKTFANLFELCGSKENAMVRQFLAVRPGARLIGLSSTANK
jgi:hypothetical protein